MREFTWVHNKSFLFLSFSFSPSEHPGHKEQIHVIIYMLLSLNQLVLIFFFHFSDAFNTYEKMRV